MEGDTPSLKTLDALLYVTKPSMNHCELPAISVRALAIQPPVQDSAVATPRRAFNKCRPTRAARRARSRSVFGICLKFRPRQVIFIDGRQGRRPGRAHDGAKLAGKYVTDRLDSRLAEGGEAPSLRAPDANGRR